MAITAAELDEPDSCQTPEKFRVLANQPGCRGRSFLWLDAPPQRRQGDHSSFLHLNVHFVPPLQMGQVHQRRIENDAIGIADLCNFFHHAVLLSFTSPNVKHGSAGSWFERNPSVWIGSFL